MAAVDPLTQVSQCTPPTQLDSASAAGEGLSQLTASQQETVLAQARIIEAARAQAAQAATQNFAVAQAATQNLAVAQVEKTGAAAQPAVAPTQAQNAQTLFHQAISTPLFGLGSASSGQTAAAAAPAAGWQAGEPQWSMKRRGEFNSNDGKSRRVDDETMQGAGDSVTALVEVLAKLSLVNAAEIRDVAAVTFTTWLLPSSAKTVEAMLEAGKQYHEEVQKFNGLGEAERQRRSEALGPPFLHVWAALIREAANETRIPGGATALIRRYWTEVVCAMPMSDLAAQVRHCRCRATKKFEGKREMARVTFAVDARYQQMEDALNEVFKAQGGVRKHGPAPRGPLEREASKLLDKMAKR